VHNGLVDELPLHPGLLRFSICSTSSVRGAGFFSFISTLL
jgi:hypothetical protein